MINTDTSIIIETMNYFQLLLSKNEHIYKINIRYLQMYRIAAHG